MNKTPKDKRYLMLATASIPRSFFVNSLKTVGVEAEVLWEQDDQFASFEAPARIAPLLDDLMRDMHDDLGFQLVLLAVHQRTSFEEKLLQNALRFLPNRCCFPTDVIMRELSFGDFSSFAGLMKLFKDVHTDLLMTVGMYLRCGLDACLSARKLAIHRNTFNYRLNAFVEKTGLDIRDYHNALLLELYFALGGGRS